MSEPQKADKESPPIEHQLPLKKSLQPLVEAVKRLSPKKEKPSKLRILADRFSAVRSIVVNALIVLFVVMVIIVACRGTTRNTVLIEPIEVPPDLQKLGYTPQVIAAMLGDKCRILVNAPPVVAPTMDFRQDQMSMTRQLFVLSPVSPILSTGEGEPTLDFEIPETHVSLKLFVKYINEVFGRARITGELVGPTNQLKITMRVNTARANTSQPKVVTFSGTLDDLDCLLAQAATNILALTHPHEMAMNYYAGKQTDAALDLIKQLVDVGLPDDKARAYSLWGVLLFNQRDYEGALEQFRAALTNSTAKSWHHFVNISLASKACGRYNEALDFANMAVKCKPKEDSVYVARANAWSALKDFTNTIADCNKAIELNPKCADAYNNRGCAKSDLQDCDGAITDCTKAIELSPEEAIFYFNLGNCNYSLTNWNEAVANYSKAIKLNPKQAEFYINRGSSYYNLAKYDEAVADFSKAIDQDPKCADAYSNRGIVKSALKDYAGAAADNAKATELNSRNNKTDNPK